MLQAARELFAEPGFGDVTSREVFARLEAEVAIESRVKGDKTIDPAYAVRFTLAFDLRGSVLDQQDSGDILTGPHADGSVTCNTKSFSYLK